MGVVRLHTRRDSRSTLVSGHRCTNARLVFLFFFLGGGSVGRSLARSAVPVSCTCVGSARQVRGSGFLYSIFVLFFSFILQILLPCLESDPPRRLTSLVPNRINFTARLIAYSSCNFGGALFWTPHAKSFTSARHVGLVLMTSHGRHW